MKANRALRDRDDAVSTVLGGILFFALVFLMLTVIRFEFVPVWEQDKEAAHMERVSGQFVALKSEVDRQAGNRTAVDVAHPVTLGFTSTSRFFTPSNLPGSLTFASGTAGATVSSDEFLVLSESGRSTAAVDEDWVSITGPTTLDSISDIQHLRIRVVDPWDETHGDNIVLTVTDADGNFAGSLTVYLHRDPPEHFLNSRVTGPSGSIIYDQGEAFHQISTVPYWWVDALEDVLHFTDVLNAAKAPFTLTLTEDGMDGEYTLTYLESRSTGSVLVGTSGVTVSNFSVPLGGGTLAMESAGSHFVDQSFYFENGAVILVQPDGAVMRVEPDFRITAGSPLTRVKMTVPALTGDADSVSQRGTVSVATGTNSARQVQGTAPMLNYTVQTQFPALWSAFFIKAAQDGGLSASAAEFVVTSGPGSATILIYGAEKDPNSTAHDLSVDLSYANIRLAINSR